MQKSVLLLVAIMSLLGCSSGAKGEASQTVATEENVNASRVVFDADSAYSYVGSQVGFGPRVPGTAAHRQCGDWLVSELGKRGAMVIEQKCDLKAFDGTILPARNILARFNPQKTDGRILLLAHWDCRPWADNDPDPALRRQPVDGANDGASGTGVLLELARHLGQSEKGVDILLVDAEDWGDDGNEDSWAMGTKYFMEHLPVDDFSPRQAILLDMVGGQGAVFAREYFSQQSAPELYDALWRTARNAGYGEMFVNRLGGAVTDDHLHLIEAGIPAVDIIEHDPATGGFNSRWHTTRDNMEGIDRATLKAVGQTVADYIFEN